MNDFVKNYEKKLSDKKAKDNAKKVGLEKFIEEDKQS